MSTNIRQRDDMVTSSPSPGSSPDGHELGSLHRLCLYEIYSRGYHLKFSEDQASETLYCNYVEQQDMPGKMQTEANSFYDSELMWQLSQLKSDDH